jgi:hypothetical protein
VQRVTEITSTSPKKAEVARETANDIVTETKKLTEQARKEEAKSGGPPAGLIASILGTVGIATAASIAAAKSRKSRKAPVRRIPVPQQAQEDSILPVAAGIGVLAVIGVTAFILTRK